MYIKWPALTEVCGLPVKKVKWSYSGWSLGRVLISFPKAVSPQVVISLLSVTHGQCDTRLRLPPQLALVTKLYRLVTEAHVCEQLDQGCTYGRARPPGVELSTC